MYIRNIRMFLTCEFVHHYSLIIELKENYHTKTQQFDIYIYIYKTINIIPL